ncbi:DUF6308 family protein [Streptomyces sp. SAS_270]|uniref:DUF6308 family protein n=1 Tax=Streptomyces sp. SAS_270 TaxID=3412748 RepID=UPI00403CE458
MTIHPGMVEDLALGTRDLYAQNEERLLGIIARQLAEGLDAPGWVERKLGAVQAVRRASQGVVDELGKAVSLEVFDVAAEAFNTGHRSAVAELGALSDAGRRLVDDVTPNAQAVDRLATETVDLLTERHRSILRNVNDRYRGIVAEVTATPLLALSVTVPAAVALDTLEGPLGVRLSGLLHDIPKDIDMADAEADLVADRSPAARAWQLLKGQSDVGWVIAGKLLARKRPWLLPVYDKVVRCALGRPHPSFWLALHAALRADDRALHRQLLALRQVAGVPETVSALRVCDVAVWMGHRSDGHACPR